MDMMSDFDNLDVIVGSDINPIERKLASAIEESSVSTSRNLTYLRGKTFLKRMN